MNKKPYQKPSIETIKMKRRSLCYGSPTQSDSGGESSCTTYCNSDGSACCEGFTL